MSTLYDRMCTILTTKFGIAAEDVGPDATFIELELDSLALVELAMATEDEFGIEIGELELTPEHTVADAVDVLVTKGVMV